MFQRQNRFEQQRRAEIPMGARPVERRATAEIAKSPFPEKCELLISRYEKQRPTIGEIVEDAPRGMYSPEDIENDIAYTQRMESRFHGVRQSADAVAILKRSQFAEAFLATRIEDENWFGQECAVFVTTRCDDVGNGVDFVLEWQGGDAQDPQYYQLAVDVTTAESSTTLGKKSDGIADSIRGKAGGKQGPKYLSEVSYYRSPHTDDVHRLTFLPKVVAALSSNEVDRAMQWVAAKQPLSQGEQKELVLPMVTEMLVQLQEQVVAAIREVCNKYDTFLPLVGEEDARPFLDAFQTLREQLRHAAITEKPTDLFAVYDAFTELTDGPLREIAVPEAYKDSIFVVHALVPVTARVHQALLEQKKRFAQPRSLTKGK